MENQQENNSKKIIEKDKAEISYDETTGNQQSRYYVKYGWADDVLKAIKNPKRMDNPLKERIRKIYNDFFEK